MISAVWIIMNCLNNIILKKPQLAYWPDTLFNNELFIIALIANQDAKKVKSFR